MPDCLLLVERLRCVQMNERLQTTTEADSSEFQLCSSPVSPLGVVPDRVVGAISDPVGERAVLLDLLTHSNLLAEGLYRTHYQRLFCYK